MVCRKNHFYKWLLSGLLCFSNSFTVLQAEEEIPAEEPEVQEITEEEQTEDSFEEGPEEEQEAAEETEELPAATEEESLSEDDTPEVTDEETVVSEEAADEETEPEAEQSPDLTAESEEETEEEPEESSEDELISEEENEESEVFEATSGTFTYTVTYGNAEITSYTGSDPIVEIPSELNGYTVTRIADRSFLSNSDITSVIIPEGVIRIGNYAFSGCENLVEIIIPESVKEIGDCAFSNCYRLTDVVLPEGLTVLATGIFMSDINLVNITIPESVTTIKNSAFDFCEKLADIIIPENVTSIGPSAFYACTSLTAITIPEKVKAIEGSVFEECINLTNIDLPEELTSIGNNAFRRCTSLTEIRIPSSVTSIGIEAFYNCTSLHEITLPENITTISNGMFYKCTSLQSITLPESVTSIEDFAFFGCSSLSEINMPAGLQSIGSDVFTGCPVADSWGEQDGFKIVNHILMSYTGEASSVIIPDGVTSIASAAFADNTNITSVVIPTGVTSIGASAFNSCGNLISVEIPDTVVNIGEYAFNECGLKTLTLPDSVTSIGMRCFASCTSLESVILSDQLDTIPYGAFSSCRSITSLTLPDHIVTVGESAFSNCSGLKNVLLNDGLETISSYAFSSCTGLETISFPSSIRTIGSYAFSGCTNLSVTSLPANVSIGNKAFSGCNIPADSNGFVVVNRTLIEYTGSNTEITIPNYVNEIAASAFFHRTDLTKVTIPTSVDSIGEYAFYYCTGITEISIPYGVTVIKPHTFGWCTALSKVSLSSNLTEIGNHAFEYCRALSSVTIPSKVTTFGTSVFYQCNSLTKVNIPEGMTEIPSELFAVCTSLTDITIPLGVKTVGSRAFTSSGLTEIDLPASVTSIKPSAFASCKSLNTVILPQGINDIQSAAFSECSSLTDVYYSGLRSQWDAISIGSDNEPLLYAALHLAEIGEHEAEGYQLFPTYGAGPAEAGKYVLAEDTVLSGMWTVPQGETTLCLHGHTITSDNQDPFRIIIPGGSKLNIEDCSDEQTGYIDFYYMKVENTAGGYTWVKPAIVIEEGGSFIMNGGMIGINSGCPSYYNSTLIELQGGSAEINGGTIVYSTYTNNTTNNRITAIGGTGAVVQSGGMIKVRATIFDFDFRQSMYGIAVNGDIIISGGEIAFEKNANFDGSESKYRYPVDIGSGGHLYLTGSQDYDGYINVDSRTDAITVAVNGCYFTGTAKILVTEPDALASVINGVEESVNDHFSLWRYEKYYFYSVNQFYYDHKIYKGDPSIRQITLDQTDVSLLEDDTAVLTATVTDWKGDVTEDELSWTSSDPEVASVNPNGLVTALSAGNAVITVSTSDGSAQAECTITVEVDRYCTLTFAANGGVFFAGTENETGSDQTVEMLKGNTVGEAAGNIIDALTNNNGSPAGFIKDDDTIILPVDQVKEQTLSRDTVFTAVWTSPEYAWTESEDGYTVTASVEGYPGNEETASAVKQVIHEVDCEAAGLILYTAEFSNVLFEVQMKEVTLEALGHDYEFTGFVWTGSDTEGYTSVSAEYVCANDSDHKQTSAGRIDVQRTEPTCEEDGSVFYIASVSAEDSADSTEHTETKTAVIPAPGHDFEEPEYVWTENDNGYLVSASTVCRKDSSHTVTETVQASYEVMSEPDCEHAGKGKYTASFEHDVFSTQTKEITLEARGHDYQFSEFRWTTDSSGFYSGAAAEYVCSHDPSHKQTKTAEFTSVRTEATCEEKGNIVYTASVSAEDSIDGQPHTDTRTTYLAARGHSYGTPVYTWEETEDGYQVTAAAVCRNDDSHVLRETVNASYQVTREPACETDGAGVYTAVFTSTQFRSQSKTVAIPATGHDYGEPVYTWVKTDEGYTVTAKTVCGHDDSHVVTETVTAGFEMIDDPAQENKTGLYTAEFENELFETQTKIWTFVSGIQTDQDEVTIRSLDETVILHVTVLPESADNKAYHWESSDETVASADEDGVVTVHSSGEAIISAVTEEGGYRAECKVTADILSTGIELDEEEKLLNKGENLTLKAVVLPEQTKDKSVIWTSSDPEVASVDENGVVTALKTGETVITAETNDTGLKAECLIRVIVSVKEIAIRSDTAEILKGKTEQLSAVLYPENAYDQNVIWSSGDTSIATVDQNGLVTAIACGTVTITAETEEGGLTDTIEITVINPVQSVTLNQSVLDLYIDETASLTVTLSPEDAEGTDLIWTSSDPQIVTVGQNGSVTAAGYGTAVVTAVTSDGRAGASCIVNTRVRPESVTLTGDTDEFGLIHIRAGDSVIVRAEILPEDAADGPVSFASDTPAVATVDDNGVVRGVSEGIARITVSAGDVSDSVRVEVREDPYGYNVNLQNNFDIIKNYLQTNGEYSSDNDTYYYSRRLSSGGQISYFWTSKTPYYLTMIVSSPSSSSSNHMTGIVFDVSDSYLFVKTNGSFTDSNGSLEYDLQHDFSPSQKYDITDPPALTNNTYSGTGIYKTETTGKSYVTGLLKNDLAQFDTYLKSMVGFGLDGIGIGTALSDIRDTIYPAAESASFSDTMMNMNVGEIRTLNVVFAPEGSHADSLEWTVSDPSVIAVTGGPANAAIKALKAGESEVSVIVNGVQLTCSVSVSDVLTFDVSELTEVLDQFREPKRLPVSAAGYEMDDLVFISGDPGVVSIGQDGYYTIHNPGNTEITVKTKDGKYERSISITVLRTIHTDGISLEQDSITVDKDSSVKLIPVVSPADASGHKIIWISEDESIAAVDEEGNVTGKANGTTVIIARTEDTGRTAQCEVTVVTPVSGIVLSAETLAVLIGETGTLTAEVMPEDATNKNIVWTSSDPSVVSVDPDGTVHALADGTATITVTAEDNGKEAQCVVAVVIPAEGIRITEQPDVIEYGETGKITVVFEPANTTNQNLIWTSSDDSIAKVDRDGVVTGTGEGTVTITAESEDGGFTAAAEILIHYRHVETVSLVKDTFEMLYGDTVTLEPIVLPENAVNRNVHFASQDTGIASVDDNGVVTAVSQGKTVIVMTSEDGELTAECTVTVHPRAIYVKEIPVQRYTGSAIKPEIKVYDSGILLTKGKDYTVTYKNNVKAASKDDLKAPSVIIKMNKKGNYSGTKTITFTIEPVDLSEENNEITVDALSAQATGKKLTPVPNVYWNGRKLKNKTEYTVDYPDWDRITDGDYSVLITGKGNYAGTRTIPLTVAPKDKVSVSKLKVTSRARQFLEMTGDFRKDILSRLTVKNGKKVLAEGADYEFVEGSENGCDRIGSCRFNIRGINDYEGEKTVTVRITGTPLTDKGVTVTNLTIYRYNGRPQKLSEQFGLKYYGNEIDPSNYEILEDTYKNNINAGTASVVIEGKNEFYGKRTVKFTIMPVTTGFTGNDITIERAYYTKGGSKPKVSVRGLEESDYTVTYLDNKAVGIGTVVVNGKGNYKGLYLSRSFRIEMKPISQTTITVKDKVYSSKAGVFRSVPVLKDTDGKTLKAGVDYEKKYLYERIDRDGNVLSEVSAKDVVPADCLVRVTVTAKGSYTGKVSAVYRILFAGTDISKAKVTVSAKEYTGNIVTLGENDLVVKVGSAVLTYGLDYEFVEGSYKKNISKGTASVMIRGINNYGGVKTVSFKISSRNISKYWEGVKDFLTSLF